jgi:hypothetical protein
MPFRSHPAIDRRSKCSRLRLLLLDCRKATVVAAETQEKENIMSKPAHKIRMGVLQVTIWRNHINVALLTPGPQTIQVVGTAQSVDPSGSITVNVASGPVPHAPLGMLADLMAAALEGPHLLRSHG